jgi:hypothetical protein
MLYKFNINYAIINTILKISIMSNISIFLFQILCTKMKHNQYGTGHFQRVKTYHRKDRLPVRFSKYFSTFVIQCNPCNP